MAPIIPMTQRKSLVSAPAQKPQHFSPLVTYALHGLEKCWMNGHGRWSHIFHLDGRTSPNQSLPHSDAFYTLNVLLGISRLPECPANIDVAAIYEQNASDLLRLPAAKYAYGMALWSAAELGLDVSAAVAEHVEALLSNNDHWRGFRAQDSADAACGHHRPSADWGPSMDAVHRSTF